LGRRRRRVTKIVKRRLPKVFDCPNCGETSIRVNISKDIGQVVVQCGNCNLKEKFEIPPSLEEIDAYCKLIDTLNKTLLTKSQP
jgi:transcription elongation factor Elf1